MTYHLVAANVYNECDIEIEVIHGRILLSFWNYETHTYRGVHLETLGL